MHVAAQNSTFVPDGDLCGVTIRVSFLPKTRKMFVGAARSLADWLLPQV